MSPGEGDFVLCPGQRYSRPAIDGSDRFDGRRMQQSRKLVFVESMQAGFVFVRRGSRSARHLRIPRLRRRAVSRGPFRAFR